MSLRETTYGKRLKDRVRVNNVQTDQVLYALFGLDYFHLGIQGNVIIAKVSLGIFNPVLLRNVSDYFPYTRLNRLHCVSCRYRTRAFGNVHIKHENEESV